MWMILKDADALITDIVMSTIMNHIIYFLRLIEHNKRDAVLHLSRPLERSSFRSSDHSIPNMASWWFMKMFSHVFRIEREHSRELHRANRTENV